MRFLDTNVFLRYLTGDDEIKAQASYELFQRVSLGEEELFTCEAIVAEVVYVLSSPRAPYRAKPRRDQSPTCAHTNTPRLETPPEAGLPGSPGLICVITVPRL